VEETVKLPPSPYQACPKVAAGENIHRPLYVGFHRLPESNLGIRAQFLPRPEEGRRMIQGFWGYLPVLYGRPETRKVVWMETAASIETAHGFRNVGVSSRTH